MRFLDKLSIVWMTTTSTMILLHLPNHAIGFSISTPHSKTNYFQSVHHYDSSFLSLSSVQYHPCTRHTQHAKRPTFVLYASSSRSNQVLPDDPFQILNLEPSPTLDKKTIKRAYKRMALKYHPDVIINQDSSPEEKKQANDNFAKINAAYATLMGKNGSSSSTGGANGGSTGAASGGGYTPPHRRTSSYYDSSRKQQQRGTSTDWQDYMPNYGEMDEQYDTNGDSFSSIFSDLLMGAAGAVAGGGGSSSSGIFRDFVEFLERNVDGYGSDEMGSSSSSSSSDDAELRILLQTGSLQDVRDEMDDTELIVQQLSSKLDNVEKELIMMQAELKQTTGKFMEKLELEEKISELQARQKVIKGYLKQARKRLVKLQTRYKELIVSGDVGGGRTKDDDSTSTTGSNRNTGYSSTSSSGYDSSGSSSTSDGTSTTGSSSSSTDDSSESWRRESFGSYGRGRGSSRSSRGRRSSSSRGTTNKKETTTASSSSTQSTRSDPQTSNQSYTRREASTSNSSSSSSSSSRSSSPSSSTSTSTTPTKWTPPVPPHRRKSSYESQAQEDKRRLREIQVDDEFEKLKKDLGL